MCVRSVCVCVVFDSGRTERSKDPHGRPKKRGPEPPAAVGKDSNQQSSSGTTTEREDWQ
jgi:hypothetical protein